MTIRQRLLENKFEVQEDIIKSDMQRVAIQKKLEEAIKTESSMINKDTGIRRDAVLML